MHQDSLVDHSSDTAEAPRRKKEVYHGEDDARDNTELKGMGDYAKDTGKGVQTKDSTHTCAADGDGGIGTSKRPETRNSDLW